MLREIAARRAKAFVNRNTFMLAPGSRSELLTKKLADDMYELLLEHVAAAVGLELTP